MLSHFSHVRLLVTPWTVAHQAPLSMGFSRQEYWSGLPFPSPGDLSKPGIKPGSPALSGGFFASSVPGKPSNSAVLRILLEKAMVPHSSSLAWRIPWTEEPGGLQSMGSQRVGHH